MLNTRFDYLRNIGVDVWTRRENVLSAQSSTQPEAVEASSSAVAVPDQVISTGNQVEINSDASTGIPALRAIAAQLRNAESASPGSSTAVPASTLSEQKEPEQKVPEAPVLAATAPSPEFLFCFLDYVPEAGDGVTLVFSLPYQAQSLPGEVRQFSDDVARGLFGKSLRPGVGELRWPMVKSAHIAQTELEAKTVVVDRVSRCQRKLILFGETIQRYVLGEAGTGFGARDFASTTLGNQEVYTALNHTDYWKTGDSMDQHSGSPKRELWRLVTEVRQALQKVAHSMP